MIDIREFDDWGRCEGLSQGSGRSEKIWLQSNDDQVGVFKFPKTDKNGMVSSTEHVSEHIASVIGERIGINTAKIDIGYRDGRIGCMSYRIDSEMEEGIHYITRKYPLFDANRLYDPNEKLYYCIEMLVKSMDEYSMSGWFVPMMVFDFLIGNSDRHQSNWAMHKKNGKLEACPLYDNGSSLCSFIREEDIVFFLGKDKLRFNALITTKSRSRIRIDGRKKQEPTHNEVLKYLIKNYESTVIVCDRITHRVTKDWVASVVAQYPESILSEKKRQLIEAFINAKVDEIRCLIGEVSNG